MSEQLNIPLEPVNRLRWLRDPYNFLRSCVFTQDQADQTKPIKPFPTELPYIEPVVRAFQEEPLLIILKSRRMTVSWTFVALYLHDCLINTERNIFFVSKKEPDANDLVKRALFIYDHIPRDVWHANLLPVAKYKENNLLFPELGNTIRAVASGADQLRQHAASGILMDEFGFWDLARETYTASKPTIQGAAGSKGGRLTIISTPPPQYTVEEPFFKSLVYDSVV